MPMLSLADVFFSASSLYPDTKSQLFAFHSIFPKIVTEGHLAWRGLGTASMYPFLGQLHMSIMLGT